MHTEGNDQGLWNVAQDDDGHSHYVRPYDIFLAQNGINDFPVYWRRLSFVGKVLLVGKMMIFPFRQVYQLFSH